MSWFIVVAIMVIAFVYINIGYLYANWCLMMAMKNFIATKRYRIGFSSHRTDAFLSKHWYMILVVPGAALNYVIHFLLSTDDNDVSSGQLIAKESGIPILLNDIISDGFKKESCKHYTLSMLFLWPCKLFCIGICSGATVAFFVIYYVVSLFGYVLKKIGYAVTLPIRHTTKLNHL